jgi:hypothetical protein
MPDDAENAAGCLALLLLLLLLLLSHLHCLRRPLRTASAAAPSCTAQETCRGTRNRAKIQSTLLEAPQNICLAGTVAGTSQPYYLQPAVLRQLHARPDA